MVGGCACTQRSGISCFPGWNLTGGRCAGTTETCFSSKRRQNRRMPNTGRHAASGFFGVPVCNKKEKRRTFVDNRAPSHEPKKKKSPPNPACPLYIPHPRHPAATKTDLNNLDDFPFEQPVPGVRRLRHREGPDPLRSHAGRHLVEELPPLPVGVGVVVTHECIGNLGRRGRGREHVSCFHPCFRRIVPKSTPVFHGVFRGAEQASPCRCFYSSAFSRPGRIRHHHHKLPPTAHQLHPRPPTRNKHCPSTLSEHARPAAQRLSTVRAKLHTRAI